MDSVESTLEFKLRNVKVKLALLCGNSALCVLTGTLCPLDIYLVSPLNGIGKDIYLVISPAETAATR